VNESDKLPGSDSANALIEIVLECEQCYGHRIVGPMSDLTR
jgi:hypothetical protein